MAEPAASSVPSGEHLCANEIAFAVLDPSPVAPGHAVVLCRQPLASWWDASALERAAIVELIDQVKAVLDERFSPAGYNVGFDAGAAAGKTTDQLVIHVIPRHEGDAQQPTGLRATVAQTPTAARPPHLLDARDERFLKLELVRCLINDEFDRVDLLVSFIMKSGLKLIAGHLEDVLERGGRVRVLTTDYLQVTDADALATLLDLSEASKSLAGAVLDVKVFSDPLTSFHPKAYLFWSSTGGTARGFVGSSNLSKSGIAEGVEWNLGVEEITHLVGAFDAIWRDTRCLPLDHAFLRSYRERWVPTAGTVVPIGVETEEPIQPVEARPIQREALVALGDTRADGHTAGLVVLATGLGKTWLAAFDSTRPEFRRTLFVAHREEILRQSRDVFRQVRPGAELGLYYGDEKQPDADVVFASIQTLARHLHRFDPRAFDYIVMDEFHAAASSYRKVLDYFAPRFLLGLTATPDRTDGADLLALCGDNLVFQLDLIEGIARGELCTFQYWGIRDVADYAHIPWRNGRFDPEMLKTQVETHDRAQQALDEWQLKGGDRTLAFCCSISHAEFMADFFRSAGVSAQAVHSGPGSASRQHEVERLRAGTLQVLFSVDVFNEGVDVPEIDTVLMLRPTESPVLFLQQLGRGLRRSEGKERLEVIDFVGNHRSFLLKPRALLGLVVGSTPTNAELRTALESGDFQLPDGCGATLELEAIELLTAMLLKQLRTSALEEWCISWAAEHGERPTAMQALRSGYNPAAAPKEDGHWFALLDRLELLSDDQHTVLAQHGATLAAITREPTEKSYKLVALRALLHDQTLRTGTSVAGVAATAHRLIGGDPRLVGDVRNAENPDPVATPPDAWERYWRKWPLTHLAKPKQSGDALFRLAGERFEPEFTIEPEMGPAFDEMVAEIVDWRLAAYLEKTRPRSAGGDWKVVSDDGQELDAMWSFEASATGVDLIIHAAGGTKGSGNDRNNDYVQGLKLVLRRLGEAGVTIREVLVDSRPARALPEDDRRVNASGFGPGPFDMTTGDVDQLAVAIAGGAANIARSEGAKGSGNRRKRLRFILDVADVDAAVLRDRLRTGLDGSTPVRCRVIQSEGRPIVMLDTSRRDDLPSGEVTLLVDGVEHIGRFAKIALNVVTLPGSTQNVLPDILRRWFGAAAGQPGTAHNVSVQRVGDRWTLSALAPAVESIEGAS